MAIRKFRITFVAGILYLLGSVGLIFGIQAAIWQFWVEPGALGVEEPNVEPRRHQILFNNSIIASTPRFSLSQVS